MPRFVVLEHDHPSLHWDLMLEAGDVLRTWRLSAPLGETTAVDALAVADHRPAYLDYEGPVSGGRGRVVRRESGTFVLREHSAGRLVVELSGDSCRGVLRLGQVAGDVWRGEWLPGPAPS